MVDQPVTPLPGSPVPTYPPELKAARVGGEVLVQFVVDTVGHVEPGTPSPRVGDFPRRGWRNP